MIGQDKCVFVCFLPLVSTSVQHNHGGLAGWLVGVRHNTVCDSGQYLVAKCVFVFIVIGRFWAVCCVETRGFLGRVKI